MYLEMKNAPPSIVYSGLLPDNFGVTVKIEDRHKLDGVSYMLQVINGVVQISFPFFIKVD